jgi:hypothetical protein
MACFLQNFSRQNTQRAAQTPAPSPIVDTTHIINNITENIDNNTTTATTNHMSRAEKRDVAKLTGILLHVTHAERGVGGGRPRRPDERRRDALRLEIVEEHVLRYERIDSWTVLCSVCCWLVVVVVYKCVFLESAAISTYSVSPL